MPPKGQKLRGMKKSPKKTPGSARRTLGASSQYSGLGTPNKSRRTRVGGGVSARSSTRQRMGFSSGPAAASAVVGPVTTSAPSSIGTTFPRSFFGFGGRAQALTDQDPEQSVRVMGRDLFDLPIKAGSSTAAAGFGGTGTYYANVAPLEISARLANLEELFIFYAIRHLRIFYAPATASTSTAQIAIGYTTELDVVQGSIAAPTQTQVMEMESSVLSSAWQPFVFEMKHEGTRLYLTSTVDTPSEPEVAVEFQGALACTLLNGVASTVYGQLWVEYIIDFYKPTPILIDPSWRISEKGLWRRSRDGYHARTPPRPSDLLRDSVHRFPPSARPEQKRVIADGPSEPHVPVGIATPSGRIVVSDEDWTVPSPPRFTPAPSAVPGASAYTAPVKRASNKGS